MKSSVPSFYCFFHLRIWWGSLVLVSGFVCAQDALSLQGGSDDTLVGPLGRWGGASDHVLFVCSVAAF